MEFTAPRADLARAAKWVARAIPRKPQVPVLAGLLITASDDGLTLSGTDYDTLLSVTLPLDVASVTEPGKCLVPGAVFGDYLAAASGAQVSGAVVGDALEVSGGRSRSVFRLLPVDDYPEFTAADATDPTSDAATLDALVGTVAGLSDPSEPPVWQEAVHLTASGGTLTATAGTRYGFGRVATKGEGEWAALVSARTLTTALDGLSGPLAVTVDGTALHLATDTHSARLRLYDAAGTGYPGERLTPMLAFEPPSCVRLPLDDLRAAVKLAQTASDHVLVDFDTGIDGEATVSAGSPAQGERSADVAEAVTCEHEGAPGSLLLAAKWLVPILAACGGDTLTLRYHPDAVKQANITDGSARFVVMPRKNTVRK